MRGFLLVLFPLTRLGRFALRRVFLFLELYECWSSETQAASPAALSIPTPRVFQSLLSPARYRGAYGGRGSGKSHFFSELLIGRCLQQHTNAVCVREFRLTRSARASSTRFSL